MKALASFLVAAALAAAGQTVAPAFDAASVKANPARAGVRLHSFPGNRFEATNVPLLQLVLVAFGEPGQMLPESQVTGGPAWIDVDRFDISATVGPAGVNTVAQKQRMLKTLLLDRFKLRTHIETHDMPIFTLTLARKNGA